MNQPAITSRASSESEISTDCEVRVLEEFAVVSAGKVREVADGQASTLVKRIAVLGFVGVDQATEWFWPGEDPAVGKRRLRNLLHRIAQQSDGVLARRNGGIVVSPLFRVDIGSLKSEMASVELALLGAPERRRTPSEWGSLERRLLALGELASRILPDDRYDDVIEVERAELSRRVMVLQRALTLARVE
jgi:DNA-binding SARP family transcriptional activator